MGSDSLRRRKFIQLAASAASAAAVSCGRSTPWRTLTASEAETAGAICDRIVPADQDAGALAAGVVNYIDRQLAGPLKKYRPAYRKGLAGIDSASAARYGKRFAALAAAEQDALLAAFEQGQAPAEAGSAAQAKAFFDLIRDHTMQGYYGDPRHGGNRDYASWRMLGVSPVPVRGRNLYDLSGEGMVARPGRTKWRSGV
ncbi:MAG TPA: gluconate 2-dehydrogenase subunit 3 family protein [Bryobacteraceae bacterium]|nr:gluconate 2-dehydrogenase subunit 3 family protein [Bryobacteraceae bacterium]